MKIDIDKLMNGDKLVAFVVNNKKCYIGPDITYSQMLELKKHFKVISTDDINLKLEKVKGLV